MADAKDPTSQRGPDIPVHPLIAKLRPNLDEPTDLVILIGFPGPSRESGNVRLYTDLTFNTYIEVPREAVALVEPTDREDEDSPTRMYIQASAEVDVVQTSTQTVAASFFRGAVTSALLAGAIAPDAAAGVAGGAKEPTAFHKCPTWPLFCPTNVIKCPTGTICFRAAQAAGAIDPNAPFGGAGPIAFGPACVFHTVHIQTHGCPVCFTGFTVAGPTFNPVQCTTFCTQPQICQTLVFGCPVLTLPPQTGPIGLGG